jgi:hypothetical protein
MSQTKTDNSWRNRLARSSISHRPGYRLFVVSVSMFLLMAVLVATRTMWIVSLDLSAQDELLELRSPWLNETMVWITRLGSRWVIGSLLLLLTAWVVRTGRCRKALMVMIVAFLANPVLEYALKAIVDRPRPDLASLVPGNGPAGDPPARRVAGITTLASVKGAASARTTKKNPAEKPKPSTKWRAPGDSKPPPSSTEKSAPAVIKAPPIIPRAMILRGDSPSIR